MAYGQDLSATGTAASDRSFDATVAAARWFEAAVAGSRVRGRFMPYRAPLIGREILSDLKADLSVIQTAAEQIANDDQLDGTCDAFWREVVGCRSRGPATGPSMTLSGYHHAHKHAGQQAECDSRIPCETNSVRTARTSTHAKIQLDRT